MDIYPLTDKKGSVSRIGVKDVVAAIFLMASRAKEVGCRVIFFPEAGGLPLKYIYERGVASGKDRAVKIFSSKITASSKSSLSKQICAILSPAERKKRLAKRQIDDFRKAITELPAVSKKRVIKSINIDHLERFNLSEIIGNLSEIGLYVPSEDKSNLVKAGIISKIDYSPENNSFKEFQNFRKKIIAYSLDYIPDIIHDVRPLLNIVLSRTNFAKTLCNNKIYVIDEAISRGRTLNVSEVIFKAFNKNAVWKIGVLFCPLNAVGRGNVDFILSENSIPPFSNRFDLMGEIVVESDIAFTRYNIIKLLSHKKRTISKSDYGRVVEYFKDIRRYVRQTLPDFLKSGILDEDDLIRLLHFIFVCDSRSIIEKCLNLNPIQINGLIEEVSFYINMPHPFDPMPIRKCYKDGMFRFLKYYEKISSKNPVKKELEMFKKNFYSIKKYYELLELQCWSKRYRNTRSTIDSLLKH